LDRDRSRLIVQAIRKSIEEKGFPPTVRELQAASGAKSTATIHYTLKRLEEQGVIRRDPKLSRGIELTDAPRVRAIPLIGQVQAGLPVLAEQNLVEQLPLPQSWLDEGSFALTVQGDSMVEAGIHEGDIAFVAPEARVKDGDIAVAMIGDEATVKCVYRTGNRVILEPRNPSFSPIVASQDDVRILGKVVGIYRRLTS